MLKLLHLDSDAEVTELLALFFEGRITMTYDEEATDIDVIVMDITLGFAQCERLKKKKNIPILITSAKDDIETKLEAFALGVNDFISKPFDPRELEIRIQLLCGQKVAKQHIHFDAETMSLRINERPISLTLAEFELFSMLYRNKGKTISRYDLANALDDIHHGDTSMDTLNVLIGRLRKKIDIYANEHSFIQTVRSVGYYFED